MDAGVGSDGTEAPEEHVEYQELYDWTVRMFARGPDEQVVLGGEARLVRSSRSHFVIHSRQRCSGAGGLQRPR